MSLRLQLEKKGTYTGKKGTYGVVSIMLKTATHHGRYNELLLLPNQNLMSLNQHV